MSSKKRQTIETSAIGGGETGNGGVENGIEDNSSVPLFSPGMENAIEYEVGKVYEEHTRDMDAPLAIKQSDPSDTEEDNCQMDVAIVDNRCSTSTGE